MTNTLEALRSGQLKGTKRLKLACGLEEFPIEILDLADSLEILDLSDNHLSKLPENIAGLKKLKIIFFANNDFTEFPVVLAKCEKLNMIGFKSNKISFVPENAFPPLLNWLILTDNQIRTLPKSLGNCHLLQKCALAGNLLQELPHEMSNCTNLELLRISANDLQTLPEWLFNLPRLSWLAFGGNPSTYQNGGDEILESFDWKDFRIQELLGEGASGLIYKALWKNKEVAVKVFKGEVTSDGLPKDEMAVASAVGKHDSLINVLGKIKNHPEQKEGLIMSLISHNYESLGDPPNFDTCTRDVFDENITFSSLEALKIAKSIASVCARLHQAGVSHGDLYAHNILVNKQADCLLGDFGAATLYDVNFTFAKRIERLEVRAFGCLLEDIFNLVKEGGFTTSERKKWLQLIETCFNPSVSSRPLFTEIEVMLTEI